MPGEFSRRGYFILTLAPLGDEEYSDAGSFEDFGEAMREAETLSRDNQDKGVYLSESAVFKAGRITKEEPIIFWWNKPYADLLEEVPRGRGYGYYMPTRGQSRFIEYEPDPAFQEHAEVESEVDEDDHEIEEEEYAKAHCESCGKIVPLYELQDFTTSEETGRSSGSSRTGQSSSRRISAKSYSSTSGSSSSRSSGRTYYKTVTTRLCAECYREASTGYWTWFVLKWGFYAIVAAIVLYIASNR